VSGDEVVEFFAAGTRVTGQYRCSECGYGITIRSELPRCPMCSGTTWEATPWSPFSSSSAFRELRQPRESPAAL
jgi:rubredoxin